MRIAYGLSIRHDALFDLPQIDARLFWQEAVQVAQGAGAPAVFYRPPLLTYLLAFAHQVLGAGPGGARLFLLALSALAAPLASRLARGVLGRTGGFVAGAVVALYAPGVFYGGELLPASTLVLTDLLVLLLLLRAEVSGRPLHYGAAGLALGVSALGSPTILLFLPLLLIRYRHIRGSALLVLAGTLLAIAPATLHNLAAGDFVLVSSNGGINFYLGNHEGATGRSASSPELPAEPGAAERTAVAIAERAAGRALAPSAVSNYWYRRGLAWIGGHPGDAAWLAVKKAYYAIHNEDLTDNIDMRAMEEQSPILRLLPVRFGLLFAFGLPGWFVLRRTRPGRLLLLYALAAALPLVLFFVVGRFRLPLLPSLATAAAAGAILIWKSLRTGLRRALLPLLGVLLGLALSFSSFLGIKADHTWHYHYLKGLALSRAGDAPAAIATYEESLRRNPRAPGTMNALAYLYAEQGIALERAEELADQALQLEPQRRAHYLDTFGWVLYKRGDLERSAAALTEAIELYAAGEETFKAEALEHLALVRDAQGNAAEAIWLRSEAARLRAGH